MDNRWTGVVALKQWRKFFQGYIREKKHQLSGSEPWHMPFLIRYVVLQNEKYDSHYFGLDPIEMNTNNMIYSGGPTLVRTTGWVIMNLIKLIGVGAGWNAGLLPAHGKAVFLLSQLAQRKPRVGRLARSVEM